MEERKGKALLGYGVPLVSRGEECNMISRRPVSLKPLSNMAVC